MKKTLLSIFSILIGSILIGQTNYQLYIQNDLNEWIPARMEFEGKNLNILNAEEIIHLPLKKEQNDTLFYQFIDYNAEIILFSGENATFSGYWINHESAIAKKRTVFALPCFSKGKENSYETENFGGKWRADIISGVTSRERKIPALMTIQQNKNRLTGTIRTNSGDYRYLEGVQNGTHFYLSSFAGNSAFYLSGDLNENGEIIGVFHNLTANTTRFEAKRDEKFDLQKSTELTKVINKEPFNLNLKDENGIQQDFQELTKGKVTIVSIFGTWCPNCVDETNYFNNELLKKFRDLKIVTVAYEATDDEAEQQKRVRGFIERKNIQGIQFLIGKKASEEHVRENFPMIDHFSGYPTSFLLDKKGRIVEIHTGFNGPATGILYEQYKEEIELKIKKLMK